MAAGILVDAYGSRFYTAAALAGILGVPERRIGELASLGLIPAPIIKFSQRVWSEAVLDEIRRLARAGMGNRRQPF
jgi:hypothetical protein